MAYRIEWSLAPGEDFYAELQWLDPQGEPIRIAGTDLAFTVGQGCGPGAGLVSATTANDGIVVFDPGVVTITLARSVLQPFATFDDYRCGWGASRMAPTVLPFTLTASRPGITSVLATGTIALETAL